MKGINTLREVELALKKLQSKNNNHQINVLVTGGAGFIGSCLIRRLLKNSSFKIFNLDKLNYASDLSRIDTDKKNSQRYKHLKIDLNNAKETHEAMILSDPDLVIHLAAESHVDRSIENPSTFLESNIIGTFNLLQAVRTHWKKLSPHRKGFFRFHHVSTDEVFGSLSGEGSFSEKSSYEPRSPYAASKASSDHIVRAWFHTYNIPIVITNSSNNFGEWQFPEKLIPLSIIKALKKENIPLYGDGQNVRDWIFVEDHIDALILCAINGTIGETYCIGASNEYTNKEVIDLICELLDKKLPDKESYSKLVFFVQDRPGHDYRYSINSNKIIRELNWQPRTKFKEALNNTVDWYLENIEWCDKIALKSKYIGERLGLNNR